MRWLKKKHKKVFTPPITIKHLWALFDQNFKMVLILKECQYVEWMNKEVIETKRPKQAGWHDDVHLRSSIHTFIQPHLNILLYSYCILIFNSLSIFGTTWNSKITTLYIFKILAITEAVGAPLHLTRVCFPCPLNFWRDLPSSKFIIFADVWVTEFNLRLDYRKLVRPKNPVMIR